MLRAGAGTAVGAGAAGLLGSQLWHSLAGGADRSDPSALVAGSLLPLASATPGASVEAHGSLAVRRLVLDGARDPDVLALADPALFAGVADETTLFATNALTVAYDPDSRFASALEDDWAAALQHPDIRVGRTDPEADPLGYRTLLGLDLAVRHGHLDADHDVLGNTEVVPETQLARVLDGGALDAAFVYRNMAVEHGLARLDLPRVLDFSDPTLAGTYAAATLDLEHRTVRGAPIRYGVTARTERGRSWVETLVGSTARLREHGFGVPAPYPVTEAVEPRPDRVRG